MPPQDKDAKDQATLGEGPTEAEELRGDVTLKAPEPGAAACMPH